MASDFDMSEFLNDFNALGKYTCIDEVMYRWNGNNWTVLTDKYGEAEVLAWLKEHAPHNVSRSTARNAWGTLKLDLLCATKKATESGALIPCQGTYVRVSESGELTTISPSRELQCSYALSCAYESAAEAPTFARFLEQILPDEELRKRVQEFVGYTLLGDHRYQCAGMWLGSGANGKGVLSNIVQALHQEVAAIQLDNKSRFALSGLHRASLIVADELPPSKLDEGRLKSVTAGEPVFIDIKGETPITTRVRGKLLVLGNNFPAVNDGSDGFWRRWEVIPFQVTIPPAQRNPKLAEQIIKTELSGVLNWAIEGLQRLLRRDGFDPVRPEAMNRAIKTAKMVADDVTGWLADRVVSVTGPVTAKKNLVYADYHHWCAANDFAPRAPQGFWLKLKRCRTDMTAKKVRVHGGATLNACSIVLQPEVEPDVCTAPFEHLALAA
ncbi:phage/plasmid primase, P4 family [Aromatoleum toluolicum]|uniref:DNA primase n=1 Tax=Aromatoleum toluolicum TaxID=90060 RepID=A0ABX1NA82_9RHOO|nr:phage/plasmid primase, P4 family [Aromatoleum toluolicum]NMF96174.1 phage/plasmid primase, P4 family [Aromatoleum toluolicum]